MKVSVVAVILALLSLVGCGAEQDAPAPVDAPPASPTGPLHVLFLAGQSNVIAQEGTGDVEGLPDDTIPMLARSIGPVGYVFDTGQTPVALQTVGGFHSLEVSAARDLQLAGWRVAVVKVARGGSWLGEWRKGDASGYFEALRQAHADAESAWGTDLVWHFVWLQSESDQQHASRADVYEENLRGFVSETREALGWKDFWQCKLQPRVKGAGAATIREIQPRVMAELTDTHLLDFDALKGLLHYTPPQLELMGKQTATELLRSTP